MDIEYLEIKKEEKPSGKKRIFAGILAIIIVLGLGAFFAYKAQNSNGPITSLSKISGKQANSLLSKRVELTGVAIKLAGTQDFAFWVYDTKTGSAPEKSLMVFLNFDLQSKTHLANNAAALKDGQLITVKGTLALTPTETEMKQLWNVNSEDAAAAAKQGIYLQADSVDLVK